MKEIRQIYLAQKKKETVHPFAQTAVAGLLLGAAAVLAEYLDRLKKN